MPEESAIDELKEQILSLREEIADLNRRLLEGQIDTWRGRLDELDVRAHLASMEVRDEVRPLLDQLDEQLVRVRSQLEDWSGAAGDAWKTLRDGAQQALADLRAGAKEALDKLRS